MNILHLINQPAYKSELLNHFCQSIHSKDGVLFIEDGVLSFQNRNIVNKFKLIAVHCDIYCLEPDCHARGILSRKPAFVNLITMGQFVDLTADFDKTISWF